MLAKQWGWAFRFPGEDGKFGTVHVDNIRSDNPFGMNEADPNGEDDVLVADTTLRLAVDQPYKVLLRSNDVLHDFWVPEFRAKMDAVPGMITYFWFTPTRIQDGAYEILCAELCGQGHYTMRGWVKVDTRDDFHSWLATQPTWAQVQAGVTPKVYSPEARRGHELWQSEGCVACHSLDGSGVIGPSWQNTWGSTRTLADGTTVTVDETYVIESIREPTAKVAEGFSPVMIAYDEATVTDAEVAALIALMKEAVTEPASEASEEAAGP